MELTKAAGSAIYVRAFAGQNWHLPLLTVGDIGELQRQVPVPSGRAFATIFEVAEWSRSSDGADAILWRSMRQMPGREKMKPEEVSEYGSVSQRVKLASYVAMESLLNGEEGDPEEGDQKKTESPKTG